MKKFLISLLTLLGISISPAQSQTQQSTDLSAALFTVPTISNDLAPLEGINGKPQETDFSIHEDEWSQVEFFPKQRLLEIQKILREYKESEAKNRTEFGKEKRYTAWRNVYVRKIERAPVITGEHALAQVEELLKIKSGTAPILYSSTEITGRVKNGFSIPIGGNVMLYGYANQSGIPVLGAYLGQDASYFKLAEAFKVLNTRSSLLLVDWRQQLIILSVLPDGTLENWQP